MNQAQLNATPEEGICWMIFLGVVGAQLTPSWSFEWAVPDNPIAQIESPIGTARSTAAAADHWIFDPITCVGKKGNPPAAPISVGYRVYRTESARVAD